MSRRDHISNLRRLLESLTVEQLRQGLSPTAEEISRRGYDAHQIEQWSEDWHVQAEYFNLAEPCYRFVEYLRAHNLLKVLAEHAGLAEAPSGATFPYLIPPVPDPSGRSDGWEVDAALSLPEPTAQARLLLWLGVSFHPQTFGAQWLFHRRVMLFLPPAQEGTRVRPINRVARWLRAAAEAIVRAVAIRREDEAERLPDQKAKAKPHRASALFIPTALQTSILAKLEGRALKKEALADECRVDPRRLYKPGGIKELMREKLVQNKRSVGYYRPNAPPPEAVSLGQDGDGH